MKKGMAALLLLTSVAAPAFAHETGVEIASIDRSGHVNSSRILDPVVTERHEYYEVTGDCEQSLQRQLAKNNIRWKDGKRYDALTTWNVKWDFGCSSPSASSCTADSFRVTVDIIYRYPRWVRPDSAPRPLVDKWDRYLRNLVLHETGHRDLVMHAAAELSRAVAALPPSANCAELDRAVCDLCCSLIGKLREKEKTYDAETRHGALQGALFP